ncbi:MAG: hypothetical protein LHV68_08690 [Elusimicrobia bacterium]|nr:hypothetical protein [Candidatus Liberimonas magnetica]
MIDMNGIKIHQHYNIPIPKISIDMNALEKAIQDISKIDSKNKFYANNLLNFLKKKRKTIRDFILEDLYYEMLKEMNISDGHWAKNYYRNILILLCNKYKLLPLAFELSLIPNLHEYCDCFDTSSLPKGTCEVYFGIFPFSLITEPAKESIFLNLSVPIEINNKLNTFLDCYREFDQEERGEVISNTTLKSCRNTLRKLILDLRIKSFAELNGERGAYRIKEYFERVRTRKTKKGTITYQYKAKNRELGYVRRFFKIMWLELNMEQDPFTVIAKDNKSRILRKPILDTIKLPKDKSNYYSRKISRKQVMVNLNDPDEPEFFVTPVFSEEDMDKIANYISAMANSIQSGLEPKWQIMDIRHMMKYHDVLQEALILAFGFLNGPRPVDYESCIIEMLGKFSTDLANPINSRFYNSFPTVCPPVKESIYKIRPEKRYFGPIFTITAQVLQVRNHILKLKHRTLPLSKTSKMTEAGTPLFMSRFYRRASYCTLTDQFRSALRKVGVDNKFVKKSTLYFMRKSFIVYARRWGMSIDDISKITGADPKTLYCYYVYLDMLKDTDKHYNETFLYKYNFQQKLYKSESKITPTKSCSEEIFNPFKPLYMKQVSSITKDDSYSIDTSLTILADKNLIMSRNMLINCVRQGYIKANRANNRWIFSKLSVDGFTERYTDAHGLMRIFKKSKRRDMTKRRALQLIVTKFKHYSIKIGNKYYVERIALYKYLDNLLG